MCLFTDSVWQKLLTLGTNVLHIDIVSWKEIWIKQFLSAKSIFILFSCQANIGQDEDFEAARKKATSLGAIKVRNKECK